MILDSRYLGINILYIFHHELHISPGCSILISRQTILITQRLLITPESVRSVATSKLNSCSLSTLQVVVVKLKQPYEIKLN